MTKRDDKGRYAKEAKTRAPKPLGDTAIVTVYLDRGTGTVSIDDEWSTPAESWFMLEFGSEIVKERLFDRHETE